MPSFETQVPHGLGRAAAIEKLRGFVDRIQEKFKDQVSGMQSQWDDNRLSFLMKSYGFEFKGVLTVEEDQAAVKVQIPIPALAFRGKIEQAFKKELEKALA